MYWVGLVLLCGGLALLTVSNPWKFFEAAQGSFFDWTEVFWYLQWGGFWLVTTSLLIFGVLAARTPALLAGWRAVPAGAGLLLFALFFIYSMPEKSNQKDWKDGWLGARIYLRTKLWARGDDRGEEALPNRLQGDWRTSGGTGFTISRDAISIHSPRAATVWNAQSCRWRFAMDYDFTFRPALESPMSSGLSFVPLNQPAPPLPVSLPDRRFPRLSCFCDSALTTWVLVDIDRLLVFTDSGQVLSARRVR